MEQHVTVGFVVDVFLLFLIGIGPKIALVPFLEITADMDSVTKGRVTQKMLSDGKRRRRPPSAAG